MNIWLGKRERKGKKNKQDSTSKNIFVKIYNMLQASSYIFGKWAHQRSAVCCMKQ